MNENVLISVIIPVYNAEKYIDNLINDVLQQTYSELEIIAINDGSKDNSLQILNKLKESDSRVKVIDIENKGVSNARNIGLENAKGKYIRFLDADDRVPSDSIERMVNPFINNNIDIVIGNYITKPEQSFMDGSSLREGVLNQNEFLDLFICYIKSFFFGVPWNKLYRKDIIDEYGIRFDNTVAWGEDFLFNLEYFKHCEKFYILNTPGGVYDYCVHDDSITCMLFSEGKIDRPRIQKMRYKAMEEYCDKFGRKEEFILEWNGTELFGRLSAATKRQLGDKSIVKRYKAFCDLAYNEQSYKYAVKKYKETGLHVWKMIKISKEKHIYIYSFLYFWIKGIVAEDFGNFAQRIKEHKIQNKPKRL